MFLLTALCIVVKGTTDPNSIPAGAALFPGAGAAAATLPAAANASTSLATILPIGPVPTILPNSTCWETSEEPKQAERIEKNQKKYKMSVWYNEKNCN